MIDISFTILVIGFACWVTGTSESDNTLVSHINMHKGSAGMTYRSFNYFKLVGIQYKLSFTDLAKISLFPIMGLTIMINGF